MSTRQDIINQALVLLKQKGYHHWSYDHISKKIGIKKASIHYHFPSKENLIAEVLRVYIEDFFSHLEQMAARLSANRDKLQGLIDCYWNNYNDPTEICLCTILASDYHILSEEILAALKSFYSRLHQWIVSLLKQGIATKEFKSSVDVESLSSLLVNTLQGLLITSKILADKHVFDQNTQQILSLLN